MLSRLLRQIRIMSRPQQLRFALMLLLGAAAAAAVLLAFTFLIPRGVSGTAASLFLGLMLIINGFSMRAPATALRPAASLSFFSGTLLLVCFAVCCAVLLLRSQGA